jgi:hypothetical protein
LGLVAILLLNSLIQIAEAQTSDTTTAQAKTTSKAKSKHKPALKKTRIDLTPLEAPNLK